MNNEIARQMNALVTDMLGLSIEYQDCHWNVTGPSFDGLHTLFGANYAQIALEIDNVAERVRALGCKVGVGSIDAQAHEKTPWRDMLRALSNREAEIVESAGIIRKIAGDMGDEATFDLMNEVIAAAQKRTWMLDAHLED